MPSLCPLSSEDECVIFVLYSCLVDLTSRHQAAFDIHRESTQAETMRAVIEQCGINRTVPRKTLEFLFGTWEGFQVICVTAEGVKDELIIFVLVKLYCIHTWISFKNACWNGYSWFLSMVMKHYVSRRFLSNLSHNKILVEWEWLCWWLHIHWWIVWSKTLKSC